MRCLDENTTIRGGEGEGGLNCNFQWHASRVANVCAHDPRRRFKKDELSEALPAMMKNSLNYEGGGGGHARADIIGRKIGGSIVKLADFYGRTAGVWPLISAFLRRPKIISRRDLLARERLVRLETSGRKKARTLFSNRAVSELV